jgi:hypothetical protein
MLLSLSLSSLAFSLMERLRLRVDLRVVEPDADDEAIVDEEDEEDDTSSMSPSVSASRPCLSLPYSDERQARSMQWQRILAPRRR